MAQVELFAGPGGTGMDPVTIGTLLAALQGGITAGGAGTAAAISGIGQGIGGIAGAIGQGQSNRASGRQAAQMDPYIQALASLGSQIGTQGAAIAGGGDYGGLRGQAANELARASGALNAQLAQRGIYSSGAALGQQRQLAGDVYSQLAQAINADQLSRQQIGLQALGQQAALSGQAAQMIAATPGYGYFDQQTGRTRGK